MLVSLDIETLKILKHSCLPHPITHSPTTHTHSLKYIHTHTYTHTHTHTQSHKWDDW